MKQLSQYIFLLILYSTAPFAAIDTANPTIGNMHSVNVADFGATSGDNIDDTTAIQAAVNFAQKKGLPLEFERGSGAYLLSRQGSITSYDRVNQNFYAVIITSSIIIHGNGAKFEIDEGDTSYATAFLVNGANSVHISDMTILGTNAARTAKHLFTGAGVAFNNSSDSLVERIHTISMRAGVHFYNCRNSVMLNNLSELDLVNFKVSGSHFAIYSGTENTIDSCVSYVSCGDGDIFLYGSGDKNTIKNSKAFNYAKDDPTRTLIFGIAQGMGADSGQRFATLTGNHVHGHFYGIDVKNDSDGTKVIGNTVISCKVGVSVRLGESPGRSYGVVIANNIINVEKGMTQFDDDPKYGRAVGAKSYGSGLYKSAGIYLEHAAGVTVTGNMIYTQGLTAATKGYRNDFVGIHVRGNSNLDESVQKGLTITGNHISHQTLIGANNYYSLGTGIYMSSAGTAANKMSGVSITGNQFDPYYGNGTLSAFIDIHDAAQVTIVGNSFSQMKNYPLLSIADSERIAISGNSTQHFNQFAAISSSSHVSITDNTLGGNSSAASGVSIETIGLNGVTYANISGNVLGDTGTNDGKFLVSRKSNWLAIIGNVIASKNWGSSNYYSLDASATNTVLVNNLVN
ncbi:MAG: NosD domain-containing protein [Gallionella sp.]|nr:NosD domain-containing protein [Gallionella sp.]MDD4959641.1 NosD domain-containing protein [Gallionella sp.]